MEANRMDEVSMLARFRLYRFRLYRLEVLNNIGYMLATLATSHGLLSSSFFHDLMGTSPLFRATVMAAAVCLMAYFMLRLLDLISRAHALGRIKFF